MNLSSIGRTHHFSPLLTRLAYAALGVLAASALTLYSFETLEKLTEKGPISVETETLTAWTKVPVQGERLPAEQIAAVDARIAQATASAQNEVKVTMPKTIAKAKIAARRVGRRRFAGSAAVKLREQLAREQQEIIALETAVEATPRKELETALAQPQDLRVDDQPVMTAEAPTVDSLISIDAVALRLVHSSLRERFAAVMDNQAPSVDTQPVRRIVSQLDEVPGMDAIPVVESRPEPQIQSPKRPDDPSGTPRPDQMLSLKRERDDQEKRTAIVAAPETHPDADTIQLSASSAIQAGEARAVSPVVVGLDSHPDEEVTGTSPPAPVAQAPPSQLAARVAPPLPDRIPTSRKVSKKAIAAALAPVRSESSATEAPVRMTTQSLDEVPEAAEYSKDAILAKESASAPDYPAVTGVRAASLGEGTAIVITAPAQKRMSDLKKTEAPKRPVTSTTLSAVVAPKTIAPASRPAAVVPTEAKETLAALSQQTASNSSLKAGMNVSGAEERAEKKEERRDELKSSAAKPSANLCETGLFGVEAFAPLAQEESLSVCRRAVSLEGPADGKQARWWEAQESSQHWPTLIYQDVDSALQGDRVPMLSFNNAKLLGAIGRTTVQDGLGIVFGIVPEGWSVELSGRAERPLFFDDQLKPINGSDTSVPRQFVFLNVAPGNPLLYVTSDGGASSGAIALVAKAGTATYIDVPAPRLRTFSGRILDASQTALRGVSAVSVEVIGQEGRTAITRGNGAFTIPNVLAFGDYPLYVDVAPDSNSFKHRYRLASTDLFQKSLFYFRDQQVARWSRQLEGGVSPASGMMVGALPREAAAAGRPAVKIRTIEKRMSLQPEAYVLGDDDHLIPDPSLSAGRSRFIGVQIPEGIAIPAVVDGSGKTLWSQMAIAQPGVLNVLGP